MYWIDQVKLLDNTNVFWPIGLATDGEILWVADWGTGIVWQIEFKEILQSHLSFSNGINEPQKDWFGIKKVACWFLKPVLHVYPA
ncbi:hypothetical protein [Shivajiella indica]